MKAIIIYTIILFIYIGLLIHNIINYQQLMTVFMYNVFIINIIILIIQYIYYNKWSKLKIDKDDKDVEYFDTYLMLIKFILCLYIVIYIIFDMKNDIITVYTLMFMQWSIFLRYPLYIHTNLVQTQPTYEIHKIQTKQANQNIIDL
jgi:hypothetical protein